MWSTFKHNTSRGPVCGTSKHEPGCVWALSICLHWFTQKPWWRKSQFPAHEPEAKLLGPWIFLVWFTSTISYCSWSLSELPSTGKFVLFVSFLFCVLFCVVIRPFHLFGTGQVVMQSSVSVCRISVINGCLVALSARPHCNNACLAGMGPGTTSCGYRKVFQDQNLNLSLEQWCHYSRKWVSFTGWDLTFLPVSHNIYSALENCCFVGNVEWPGTFQEIRKHCRVSTCPRISPVEPETESQNCSDVVSQPRIFFTFASQSRRNQGHTEQNSLCWFISVHHVSVSTKVAFRRCWSLTRSFWSACSWRTSTPRGPDGSELRTT